MITFNRTPRVAVRLTNDLEELREGLTGLLAEDQTSLYDSLAYALQYLSGVKGQRAVLLLSDGMDRSSRLTFEQSLECARRAGIAVYAIGLGLPDGARGEAGDKLRAWPPRREGGAGSWRARRSSTASTSRSSTSCGRSTGSRTSPRTTARKTASAR